MMSHKNIKRLEEHRQKLKEDRRERQYTDVVLRRDAEARFLDLADRATKEGIHGKS